MFYFEGLTEVFTMSELMSMQEIDIRLLLQTFLLASIPLMIGGAILAILTCKRTDCNPSPGKKPFEDDDEDDKDDL